MNKAEITVSRKKSFCQAQNEGSSEEKLMPGKALVRTELPQTVRSFCPAPPATFSGVDRRNRLQWKTDIAFQQPSFLDDISGMPAHKNDFDIRPYFLSCFIGFSPVLFRHDHIRQNKLNLSRAFLNLFTVSSPSTASITL
jgi:hypothetical protein